MSNFLKQLRRIALKIRLRLTEFNLETARGQQVLIAEDVHRLRGRLEELRARLLLES